MSYSEFAEQPIIQKLLVNSLTKNRLAHLYIFHGSHGTGRMRTAIHLSKAIFCENQDHQYCDTCKECRNINQRNHPHVQIIEPDGSTLKIEQMRQIKKNFSLRTLHDQPRVYIFREADKMTTQAANSLLHFLEEPSAQLLAILITENLQAILPTIQSRAQSISFTPLSRELMANTLHQEGEPETLLRAAVQLTAGLPEAREWIHAQWFADIRNVVLQLAKESSSNFAISSITFQHKVMKTQLADHISTMIDLFILWFKDMIQLHLRQSTPLVFEDQKDWMEPLAMKKSVSHWISMMGQAVEIQKRIRFNANTQLLVEKMLLKLQEG